MINLNAIKARADKAIDWVNVQYKTDVSSRSLIQLGWDIKALIAEVKRLRAEVERLSQLAMMREGETGDRDRKIKRLQSELTTVTAERDAAVEDCKRYSRALKRHGIVIFQDEVRGERSE